MILLRGDVRVNNVLFNELERKYENSRVTIDAASSW